MIMGMIKNNRR